MPTNDDTTPTRGRGRPRTRPTGVRERPVYLTDAEAAEIDLAAAAAGLSRAEWLRRMALKALKSRAKR